MSNSRLHLGTIIDESYFESYHEIKGDNVYLKKICLYCREVVELGFERLDKNGRCGGFAGTLPHECKIWVDEARHRLGYQEYLLHYQGFLSDSKPKRIIDTTKTPMAENLNSEG